MVSRLEGTNVFSKKDLPFIPASVSRQKQGETQEHEGEGKRAFEYWMLFAVANKVSVLVKVAHASE